MIKGGEPMEAYSKEFRRDVLRACDAGGGTREVALVSTCRNRGSDV
jgi:hypothetical protein